MLLYQNSMYYCPRTDMKMLRLIIWRLGQAKDSGIIDLDWNELADVINKAYLQIPTSFLDNKTSIKMIFKDDEVYDINGDGVVDISDITILVNDVLNK